MPPSRPISGVVTDALRRYAVKIQLTAFSDVCSACWMSGSAGATSDCSSAYELPPSASTRNVRLGCWRSVVVSAGMRGEEATLPNSVRPGEQQSPDDDRQHADAELVDANQAMPLEAGEPDSGG